MIGKDVGQRRRVGWGRGVCRQGEDGIMTGLSPLNRVCEGGEEKEREEEEDPNLSTQRLGLFFFRTGLK